jgi:AraC-like DNA-binding protein
MRKRRYNHGHRQRLDRAIENFLDDCYQRGAPVRGKDLARSLSMTPEYTSFLGANVFGGSIHAYVRRKQLTFAARLLTTTPLSIEEIAIRTGFGTRATFHRWFLAEYGVTPAAFRVLKK